MRTMVRTTVLAAAALVLGSGGSLAAQDVGEPLAPGTHAPDFALVGATVEGVLPDAISPSDFRGHTLVIAFFYRARSSG